MQTFTPSVYEGHMGDKNTNRIFQSFRLFLRHAVDCMSREKTLDMLPLFFAAEQVVDLQKERSQTFRTLCSHHLFKYLQDIRFRPEWIPAGMRGYFWHRLVSITAKMFSIGSQKMMFASNMASQYGRIYTLVPSSTAKTWDLRHLLENGGNYVLTRPVGVQRQKLIWTYGPRYYITSHSPSIPERCPCIAILRDGIFDLRKPLMLDWDLLDCSKLHIIIVPHHLIPVVPSDLLRLGVSSHGKLSIEDDKPAEETYLNLPLGTDPWANTSAAKDPEADMIITSKRSYICPLLGVEAEYPAYSSGCGSSPHVFDYTALKICSKPNQCPACKKHITEDMLFRLPPLPQQEPEPKESRRASRSRERYKPYPSVADIEEADAARQARVHELLSFIEQSTGMSRDHPDIPDIIRSALDFVTHSADTATASQTNTERPGTIDLT